MTHHPTDNMKLRFLLAHSASPGFAGFALTLARFNLEWVSTP